MPRKATGNGGPAPTYRERVPGPGIQPARRWRTQQPALVQQGGRHSRRLCHRGPSQGGGLRRCWILRWVGRSRRRPSATGGGVPRLLTAVVDPRRKHVERGARRRTWVRPPVASRSRWPAARCPRSVQPAHNRERGKVQVSVCRIGLTGGATAPQLTCWPCATARHGGHCLDWYKWERFSVLALLPTAVRWVSPSLSMDGGGAPTCVTLTISPPS